MIGIGAIVRLGLYSLNICAEAQTWPTDWVWFEDDPDEDGTADDRSDVDSAYDGFDVLNLRSDCLNTADSSVGRFRYTWFVHGDRNAHLAGGTTEDGGWGRMSGHGYSRSKR